MLWRLAASLHIIVACGAGEFGLVVIEHRDIPVCGLVTVFARVVRLDVGPSFSDGDVFVVAAEAAFDDWAVINVDGLPV